jgi:hypothetical protein
VNTLEIEILADTYAVSQLSADAPIPEWARGELVALTRTGEELSIASPAGSVPETIRSERDWRVLRVAGPLDLSLIGILAALAGVLADASIPIFAVSTFATDYLLVRERDLARAARALESAGHCVRAAS